MMTPSNSVSRSWWWAGLVVAASCTVGPLPTPPQVECNYNSDCPTGKVCGAGGSCLAECKVDRDCKDPLVCRDGACVSKVGQCVDSRQCADGQVCTATGVCAKACTTASECGDGFDCQSGGCVSKTVSCARDNECSADQVCSGLKVCSAACTTSAGCGGGLTCSAGACVAPPKCTTAADCTAPDTCTAGVCTRACTKATDCASGYTCGPSGTCVLLPASCTSATDCPTGKTCANSVCTGACVAARDCRDGQVCSFGVCVAPGTGCLEDSNCAAGKACSPNGECVASCTTAADCASTETCSNGACVGNGPTTATISGSVKLTGLTNHAGITVTLAGPSNKRITTVASGAYSFAGLTPGRYTLTFIAPSTAQHQLAIDVAATAGTVTTAPDVGFTPVGILKGNVKLQGSPQAAGIQVALVGLNMATNTNSSGDFTLNDVPIGVHSLLATAPLFLAANPMTPAVVYNSTVTQPDISLQPAPVTTGSVFSFVTAPANVAKVGQSYLYTALAGGGGIQAPSYAVVQGPPNYSIDPITGVVTFVPLGTQVGGNYWVILSATGGNATVYQIYELMIRQPFPLVATFGSGAMDSYNGSTWVAESSGFTLSLLIDGGVAPDGGSTTRVTASDVSLAGTANAVTLVNGGTITSVQAPSGTFTGISGPLGVASATWLGGSLTGVTVSDAFTVASRSTLPTATSAKLIDGELMSAATYPSGPASVNDGRAVPTAVSADTGLVTSVTATVLTDATANFGAVTGRCVTDVDANAYFTITSSTATTLTITTGDLTTVFSNGRRYFVIDCFAYTMNYTLTQAGASFGALTGQRVDAYANATPLGYFTITSNTATTITFAAPFTSYADFASMPTNGFYAVGGVSGVSVVMTDATASFAGGLSGTNRLGFDGNSNTYAISSNTATAITFTAPSGSLTRFTSTPQVWRLTDTSSRTVVTATFAGAPFTAGAFVGRYLWVDSASTYFQITANTTNTISFYVGSSYFPLVGWAGTYAAALTASTFRLTFEVTDSSANYAPNGLAGFEYIRAQATSAAWRGSIVSNTATTMTVQANATTIRDLLPLFAPGRYGFGNSTNTIRLRYTVAESPAWPVDSLVSRGVTFVDQPSQVAPVGSNTANSVTLEVPLSYFGSFDAVGVGASLWLGANENSGAVKVVLADSTKSFGVNAYQGYGVTLADGSFLGTVLSNTATQLTVLADPSATSAARAGVMYALGNTAFASCGSYGRVDATVSLAGASLTPNAYQALLLNYASFPVVSNSAASLNVALCGSSFSSLVAYLGQVGFAMNNGRVSLTFTDSAGTLGSVVGSKLGVIDPNAGSALSPSIVSNTATQVVVGFTTNELSNFINYAHSGVRYVVVDAGGDTNVTMTTNLTLTPDALKGRVVSFHGPNSYDAYRFLVQSNTANSLVVRLPYWAFTDFAPSSGAPRLDRVTTSLGVVVRVDEPASTFTPQALVGRSVQIGNRVLQVLSNTDASFTAMTSDTSSLLSLRNTLSYAAPSYSPVAVAALSNGDAAFAANDGYGGGVWRVTPGGTVSVQNAFTTGHAVTLQPAAALTGTVTGTQFSTFSTLRDGNANFTPNALVGAIVRTHPPTSTTVYTYLVVANTAKSLTVYRSSGSFNVGDSYSIEPLTYQVTGAPLTAGALAGRRLRVNGYDFAIRSNTANSVSLVWPGSSAFDSAPALSGETTAVVLDGVDASAPRQLTRWGSGYVVATSAGLSLFDGSSWSRLGEVESATPLVNGTVTSSTNNSLLDQSANFTPNALAGKRVRLAAGVFTVSSNTANTLFVSGLTPFALPLPTETYAVIDTNGLGVVNDVGAAGSSLWVATPSGARRLQGSTWSSFTVASTESAAGKADGLLSDAVWRVAAVSDTEAWFGHQGEGASHVGGATWAQYTQAKTESAPGKNDALPPGTVFDVLVTPAEGVWFATTYGVAQLKTGTWSQLNSAGEALPGVGGLALGANGEIWASSYYGLMRLGP